MAKSNLNSSRDDKKKYEPKFLTRIHNDIKDVISGKLQSSKSASSLESHEPHPDGFPKPTDPEALKYYNHLYNLTSIIYHPGVREIFNHIQYAIKYNKGVLYFHSVSHFPYGTLNKLFYGDYQITTLGFENCNLNPFYKITPANTFGPIKKLELKDNYSQPYIMLFGSIKEPNYDAAPQLVDVASMLYTIITENTVNYIEELVISGCDFNEENTTKLARVINNLPKLINLILSGNNICAKTLYILLDKVTNNNIKFLDLTNNELTDTVTKTLDDWLRDHQIEVKIDFVIETQISGKSLDINSDNHSCCII